MKEYIQERNPPLLYVKGQAGQSALNVNTVSRHFLAQRLSRVMKGCIPERNLLNAATVKSVSVS